MGRLLAAALVVASIGATLVATARTAAADDVPLYTCKQAPAKTKISVEFHGDPSVMDLATWVMGFTCKNVVIDAEVRARVPRVTIVAPVAMTPKQALQLFVDAVEATGLVVQQKKDTIIIKLGPKMPKTCPSIVDTSVATTPTTPPTPTTPTDPSDDELQKRVDAGIRRISDTQVEITRDLVDAVLVNPMAIAKGARVVPAVKDGKAAGFKLYAIRPSSIYAKLGFMNGDTLKRINGFELDSADKALEVYTKLREATSIEVELERRGKPVSLRITIK
jgi:hypothetical protein